MQYIPVFMGAASTQITFGMTGLDLPALSLVQSLLYRFPSIREITITNLSPDMSDLQPSLVSEALSHLFSHCQGLQAAEFSGGPLPLGVVEHLANSGLKKLLAILDDSIITSQASGYHALEHLQIYSHKLQTISSFIRMLHSPLRNATFILDKSTGIALAPVELTHMFDTMKMHCSLPDLRTLIVSAQYMKLEPRTLIDESVLRPLLAFRNLSSVELSVEGPIHLGNAMIVEMAAAWPRLSSLQLGSSTWTQKSSVTLTGLLPLLELPELSKLWIAVDTSFIDPEFAACPQKINTKLRFIDFLDSIVEDAELTAAWLSHHVHNIDTILGWEAEVMYIRSFDGITSEMATEYREMWDDVARRVRIANIKKKERARAARSS